MTVDPEQTLLILPADHEIPDINLFKKVIKQSSLSLEERKIMLFGIDPLYPSDGFGYIELGKKIKDYFDVNSFKEKPTIKIAESYLKQGNFLWNSGIFMFKAKDFIKEMELHNKRLLDLCKKTIATRKELNNSITFADEYYKNIESTHY